MITMVLDRTQRPYLARVGLCEQAGEKILSHMAEELADMKCTLEHYAMDDFSVVADLRSNRRVLQQRMGKMARLTQTAVELAMKARLSHGLITLTFDEQSFLSAWCSQKKPVSERDLDSETIWMLEMLVNPNM